MHKNHHYTITHYEDGKEEVRCYSKECKGKKLSEKEKEELIKQFCS